MSTWKVTVDLMFVLSELKEIQLNFPTRIFMTNLVTMLNQLV